MKIVFMGTPQFAVPSLKILINDVVAVFTKAPKPADRGYKEVKSPIHILAEEHNIDVFTPKSLKTEVEMVKALNADLCVVCAYGLIIPKDVIELFPLGVVNVHPSSLPRWRGAAPIQRTVFAGDTESSICIMRMDEGLDTGDVITQEYFKIDEKITAHELAVFCAEEGSKLLFETIKKIQNGTATYTKQSDVGVTYAHKITKEDELIDWSKSAREINCQIRALSPKPGAYFRYKDEIIKIITAEYSTENSINSIVGQVIDDNLSITCGSGVLKPTLLQRQGKKMIYTDAFLRGFPIVNGEKLS